MRSFTCYIVFLRRLTTAPILFTDFSKGFDLEDHSGLVSELRDLGVHEALIRWIGAFLTGRSQLVKICSALSNSVILRGAIPQGIGLAHLQFAVLVNNLMKGWKTRVKYMWTIFQSYWY